ncbi:VCBS repeat-containing protein [Azonexus sp. IMCC34839]|uniref:VCBS repeat-containing protein n=1 Tax=Azonexus sp. IMCC34839 TaxID=3133695 RepID=UPI00399A2C9D
MKIASSTIALSASHAYAQQREVSESLTVTIGRRTPTGNDSDAAPSRDRVSLSGNAPHPAPQGTSNEIAKSDQDSEIDKDPKLSLIRSVVEMLLGHRLRLFDVKDFERTVEETEAPASSSPAETQNAPSAGFGIAYDYHSTYSEVEQTTFSASGVVNTADGREISFNVNLSMSRSYYEETNVSIRLGDAAKTTDPLVLNFAGTAAQLTDQRFSFDLNADGQKEQINFVAPGSGFLVFDRNGDGKVNDGRELFGPTTGEGFQELAVFDADQNQWIDENDAIYDQLKIWTRNAEGKEVLRSLREANVGAINLSHVATPFSIKNAANELQAQIRTSGTFLQEDGNAGTIQQIDLTA